MDDLFALIQKTYGIAGLLILSPFFAVYFLYKDNLKLRAENLALVKEHKDEIKTITATCAEKLAVANDKQAAVQVQRVQDAQGVSSSLLVTVGESNALKRELKEAMDQLTEVLPKRIGARTSGLLPPSSRG